MPWQNTSQSCSSNTEEPSFRWAEFSANPKKLHRDIKGVLRADREPVAMAHHAQSLGSNAPGMAHHTWWDIIRISAAEMTVPLVRMRRLKLQPCHHSQTANPFDPQPSSVTTLAFMKGYQKATPYIASLELH
jgi:hypothetical protein